MESTWIITRAQDESAALVSALRARGVSGLALPCIERELLPWPRWPKRQSEKTRYLLFLTSLAAARCAHQAFDRYQPLAKKGRLLIAASAPRTDAWLVAQGHRVAVRAEQGAVGLAQAVREWNRGARLPLEVLYPSSDAGEGQPEQAQALEVLRALGSVTRANVYQTRAPSGLRDSMAAVPRGPTRWLFASPSAVVHALEAMENTKLSPAVDVLCLGASTLRTWRDGRPPGWPSGTLHPPQADLADVILQFEGVTAS